MWAHMLSEHALGSLIQDPESERSQLLESLQLHGNAMRKALLETTPANKDAVLDLLKKCGVNQLTGPRPKFLGVKDRRIHGFWITLH